MDVFWDNTMLVTSEKDEGKNPTDQHIQWVNTQN